MEEIINKVEFNKKRLKHVQTRWGVLCMQRGFTWCRAEEDLITSKT